MNQMKNEIQNNLNSKIQKSSDSKTDQSEPNNGVKEGVELNINQKQRLTELLDYEHKKINLLAGNAELLKVLKRSNSIQKFSNKTSRLDISHILESSLNKSTFADLKNRKNRKSRQIRNYSRNTR